MIGNSKETKNQKERSEQSPRNRRLKKTGWIIFSPLKGGKL